MTDAPGIIIALDGEYAMVLMEKAGCGRCNEEGGCGGNNLGNMLCGSPRTFRVLNKGNSVIGDRVTISIAEGAVRRSAVLAYGLPLLALFVGTLAGSALAGETGSIVGAIVGLTSAWSTLRYAQIRGTRDSRYQSYIRY
jgi:sigma-E factor negative regulatory protein RseC